MTTETREQWLMRAADWMRSDLFKRVNVTVPPARISTGFTGSRASSRNTAIGSCWRAEAAADAVAQIFISPVIADSSRALDILAHELIHAVHPNDGHGPEFRRVALAIGLTGKMTATVAGPELRERLNALIAPGGLLGPYPHAELRTHGVVVRKPGDAPGEGGGEGEAGEGGIVGVKKQTTRLLKLACKGCGFICRASRTAVTDYGAPSCACGAGPLYVDESKKGDPKPGSEKGE